MKVRRGVVGRTEKSNAAEEVKRRVEVRGGGVEVRTRRCGINYDHFHNSRICHEDEIALNDLVLPHQPSASPLRFAHIIHPSHPRATDLRIKIIQ
ncbi:hypothetical protein E2C01_029000 [Portunus trituberculatus]|uniref:Uncharacterized protein n=1 Tax=Portunus trituberculatus TaxID=210409 RepID=A0A5B7ETG9_PORTR|nr:hypothetical protein [Portunus trituberculatus]